MADSVRCRRRVPCTRVPEAPAPTRGRHGHWRRRARGRVTATAGESYGPRARRLRNDDGIARLQQDVLLEIAPARDGLVVERVAHLLAELVGAPDDDVLRVGEFTQA